MCFVVKTGLFAIHTQTPSENQKNRLCYNRSMTDFLSNCLGNPDRARIVRTFVINDTKLLSPTEVTKLSGVTPQKVTKEIQALSQMGLLKKTRKTFEKPNGKSKKSSTMDLWALDLETRPGKALANFVHDVSPTQFQEVEKALKTTGRLSAVILSGIFMGDPSRPADMIIAGDSMNERRIERVMRDLEPKFGREIRYSVFSTPEFRYRLTVQDRLLRDVLDFPHRILFSRTGIL